MLHQHIFTVKTDNFTCVLVYLRISGKERGKFEGTERIFRIYVKEKIRKFFPWWYDFSKNMCSRHTTDSEELTTSKCQIFMTLSKKYFLFYQLKFNFCENKTDIFAIPQKFKFCSQKTNTV